MALDHNPRRKQFALVSPVFVHYPNRDRFNTFEARPRIEMPALPAAVQVSVALWARAVEVDFSRSLSTARGALRRFAKCHHAWRARSLAILRL